MPEPITLQTDEADWIDAYRKTRAYTDWICSPLETDDYQLQSIVETSPPKWHIAHVSCFFETFILTPFLSGYRPFHPSFAYLFNSYYETVGSMHPRPKRGMLSRPTVTAVYDYRAYVDEHMLTLLSSLDQSIREDINSKPRAGRYRAGLAGYLLYPIPTDTPEGLPFQTALFMAFSGSKSDYCSTAD